jgi:hypothetical protein
MNVYSSVNVISVCGHLVSRCKVSWGNLLLKSKCLCTSQAGAALAGRSLAVDMRNLASRAALILGVHVSTTFDQLASGGVTTGVTDLHLGAVIQGIGLRDWHV